MALWVTVFNGGKADFRGWVWRQFEADGDALFGPEFCGVAQLRAFATC